MPRVEPFRALRYAPAIAPRLAEVIAPPYDVITPEQRGRLAAHPDNIVHVDLPVAAGGGDRYAAAASILAGWVKDGILIRDPEPSYYLCEQTFRIESGASGRRLGLFARLGLEPYDSGVVVPHERTHEGPRVDRLHLLEATHTHVSPLLLLHSDPGGEVARLLARLAGSPPAAAAQTDEGIGCRLWRLSDPATVERIRGLLRDAWLLIADGHHRYESALEYDRLRGGRTPGSVLACLCSLEDPGVRVLPIHRRIRGLARFDGARIRAGLSAWFDLDAVARTSDLPALVASRASRPGTFGLMFGDDPGAWVASWREGAGLERPTLAALAPELRRLDVILLHRLVLEETIGLSLEAQSRQDHLEYVKDGAELMRGAGEAQLSVLMNPMPMEQVMTVARAGLRLPQKSTFFDPKVPSGLVLDPIEQGP
jgi:uncharacterized protein (DUF1015 family)